MTSEQIQSAVKEVFQAGLPGLKVYVGEPTLNPQKTDSVEVYVTVATLVTLGWKGNEDAGDVLEHRAKAALIIVKEELLQAAQ